MGIFNRFPYSSTHEMNLDFMLGKAQEINEQLQTVQTGMQDVQTGLSQIDEQTERATTAAAAAEAARDESQQNERDAFAWTEQAEQHADRAEAALSQMTDDADRAEAAADRAEAAANAASISASAASNSANIASQNAATAAQQAANAELAAQNAANALNRATVSANNAQTSAVSAADAAALASGYNSQAATSATNAATSATNAATSAASVLGVEQNVQDLVESIPEDYSTLSNDVNDLKSAIDELVNGGFVSVEIEHTDGGYIKDSSPGSLIEYEGWKYTDYIDISKANGKIKVLMTYGAGIPTTDGDIYNAYYDKNKSYIGVLKITNNDLVVPDNAYYVRLSCRSNYTQALFIGYDGDLTNYSNLRDVDERVRSLETNLDGSNKTIRLLYTLNGYIRESTPGDVISYSGWKYTDYIDISDNNGKIKVICLDSDGSPTTDGKCYNAFYYSDYSYAGQLQVTNQDLEVPSGAKYIRLSCRSEYSQTVSYIVEGINQRIDTLEDDVSSLKQSNQYIKIMTWNIGIFKDGTHKPNTEEAPAQIVKMRKTVGQQDADVLNMQEYVDAVDASNTVPSTNLLNFKYQYKTSVGSNKCFTKYAIKSAETITFTSGSNRFCRAFTIDYNGIDITIINYHSAIELDPSVHREADAAQIIEYMQTKPYCILTGDFNAASDAEYDQYISAGFTVCNGGIFGWFDTWPVWANMWDGFTTDWPCYHLNNIIVSNNIIPQYAEAVESDISDHAPFVAILKIN